MRLYFGKNKSQYTSSRFNSTLTASAIFQSVNGSRLTRGVAMGADSGCEAPRSSASTNSSAV